MYEHYLTAVRNGVTDIDIDIDEENYWQRGTNPDNPVNPDAVTVTVTFAATTDSTAWITIDGNGLVYPSFGGTGTGKRELDAYAEQAVEVWRAVMDDDDTTCRYKVRDEDAQNQDAEKHVIDA